uniref:Uncharacterized protein n=1 Tax=Ditylenchus dipsaci TaxID=166011 RepID=A0A915CT57_9BILA
MTVKLEIDPNISPSKSVNQKEYKLLSTSESVDGISKYSDHTIQIETTLSPEGSLNPFLVRAAHKHAEVSKQQFLGSNRGRCCALLMEDRTAETNDNFVMACVDENTVLVSDEWPAHKLLKNHLANNYDYYLTSHNMVKHKETLLILLCQIILSLESIQISRRKSMHILTQNEIYV